MSAWNFSIRNRIFSANEFSRKPTLDLPKLEQNGVIFRENPNHIESLIGLQRLNQVGNTAGFRKMADFGTSKAENESEQKQSRWLSDF